MYQYKVKVVKVIDGDTVDVDVDLGFSVVLAKQRVRLHGIDTPESRTRDKEEKVRGLLSKAFLLALCPIGSTIHLQSHGKGKFGRILGELYEVDDDVDSINKKMCDEAFAVPYFGQSKEDIEELHSANRDILIEKGIL
jgi:micrococcal nuclease